MPLAVPTGRMVIAAIRHPATQATIDTLALGSQPAMATDLLVVSGAVSSGTGFTPTPIGLTDQPPFAYDDIPFAALRSHHHLIPRFLRGDKANIIPP